MRKSPLMPFTTVALVAAAALFAAPMAGAKSKNKLNPDKVNPVLMVHGGSGSAAQYASQAMRLHENGYPNRYINVYEYDSTLSRISFDGIDAQLDAAIARIKQRTGKDRVDVMGHSFGTTQWHRYLNSSAERAANVGNYVNIDGRRSATPPGGVRTLAIWAGRGDPDREIGGARNRTIPNQTHVESATSRQSFEEIFKFLTRREPRTTRIEKANRKMVKIAGKAVLFPQNVALEETNAFEVWRVKAKSGERKGKGPFATPQLSDNGSWGPIKVRRGKHYEFALLRNDGSTHHIYYEPFRRDDRLVRLLSSNPGEGIERLLDTSPDSTGAVITRNKEMWGDQPGENDILKINGQNVINPATSPIDNRTIAMFAFDEGSDGVSDLSAPIPIFFALPFLSAVDLFVPASQDSVEVKFRSRSQKPTRKIYFPARPGTADRVTVQLNDYEK